MKNITSKEDKELRNITFEDSEFRAFEEDNQMVIEGYPIIYGKESRTLQTNTGIKFNEIISQRALDGALSNKEYDIYLAYNHNPDNVMANTRNGTLILTNEEKGVRMKAILNDTTIAKDVFIRVKRGDIGGLSFGMENVESTFERRGFDKPLLRKVSKINTLFDISVVTTPAYPQTSVFARGLDEAMNEDIDMNKVQNEIDGDMLQLLKLKSL
jgi:uncharacterized protein